MLIIVFSLTRFKRINQGTMTEAAKDKWKKTPFDIHRQLLLHEYA